jgi:hypothetical protein
MIGARPSTPRIMSAPALKPSTAVDISVPHASLVAGWLQPLVWRRGPAENQARPSRPSLTTRFSQPPLGLPCNNLQDTGGATQGLLHAWRASPKSASTARERRRGAGQNENAALPYTWILPQPHNLYLGLPTLHCSRQPAQAPPQACDTTRKSDPVTKGVQNPSSHATRNALRGPDRRLL